MSQLEVPVTCFCDPRPPIVPSRTATLQLSSATAKNLWALFCVSVIIGLSFL